MVLRFLHNLSKFKTFILTNHIAQDIDYEQTRLKVIPQNSPHNMTQLYIIYDASFTCL